MKWLKGFGRLFLILSFMTGALGCSTGKVQLKNETGQETLAKPENRGSSSSPAPSLDKEKDLTGEKGTIPEEGESVCVKSGGHPR